MIRILFLCVLAFYNFVPSYSTPMEKLHLKGDVIVEGHIISQALGESVTFSVERTYATVKSSWVKERKDETKKVNSLKESWQTWVNEDFDAELDNITLSTIKLADIGYISSDMSLCQNDSIKYQILSSLFKGRNHIVYVFEDGAFIRFVDLSPCEHRFSLSDIISIEYKERQASAINGIVDIVELKSGDEFKGQITKKILGEQIRMKTNEGKILNILNKDVKCLKKEGLNPALPIFYQAEYLDKIGDTLGLISYQNNNNDIPYIILLDENNSEKRFELKDVKSIFSLKNEKYVLEDDIKIKGDEVYFNRQKVSPASFKNKKGLYILEDKSRDKILQLNTESDNMELTVEMADTEDNRSAYLFPVTMHKSSLEFRDVIVESISASSVSVSRNNTLRKVYIVEPGIYALYFPKRGMSYFCKIN